MTEATWELVVLWWAFVEVQQLSMKNNNALMIPKVHQLPIVGIPPQKARFQIGDVILQYDKHGRLDPL